ncbi:hypothetical protein PCAR4_190084 [Paraburkholderia caribensis]|nr:hypothetical protein PCAR4_190084 [Paraburkholderia caribensis]
MALVRLATRQVVPEIAHLRRTPGGGRARHAPDSMRTGSAPLLRLFSLAIGSHAHIARDIATQVATRRRRGEILVTRFCLLPCLKRGRLLRPPVPALRSLLRGCSRGEQ